MNVRILVTGAFSPIHGLDINGANVRDTMPISKILNREEPQLAALAGSVQQLGRWSKVHLG